MEVYRNPFSATNSEIRQPKHIRLPNYSRHWYSNKVQWLKASSILLQIAKGIKSWLDNTNKLLTNPKWVVAWQI